MNKGVRFLVLTAKTIAYTGMMTAIVYVCTLIGIPFPAFNFNIGDSAILICGAMFNPLCAMIAGGLGSFLADLTTYPATMLYTLVIKAIEGLVAGFIFQAIYRWYDKSQMPAKKKFILKVVFAVLTCLGCSLFMAGGYFICKAFMYGTIESALTSLPKNILQAVVSTALASLVLYAGRLEKTRHLTYGSFVDLFTKPVSQPTSATDDEENDDIEPTDEIKGEITDEISQESADEATSENTPSDTISTNDNSQ